MFEAQVHFQGASSLAKYLEQTYGKDAFAMIVDEGGKLYLRSSLAKKGSDDFRR